MAAVELATGYISLAVSTKGLGADMARQFTGVERQADASGKRAGGKFKGGILGAAKGIAGPLVAAFAAMKGVEFLGSAIAEGREAQKVGARTAAIIKATGGAAKVTEKQVGDLATRISQKSGIDDEAIQSGANLLLTFKKVRNEAGKGNQVFDRATQAATDLSAAGFGSITSSSKMLGKALNDPVKGISALSRAGVTFTDQQKNQIKTLVKSGDVLGAQKLILKEVEGQVGGVAAASATAGEKMSVAWGNLKEQIGTALIPVLDRVQNVITNNVIPAVSSFVSLAGPAFASIGARLGPLVTGVKNLFASVQAGSGAAGFIQTKLVPAFLGIVRAGQQLGAVVVPIVRALAAEFLKRWPQIQPVVVGVFQTIGGIVLDVMALIKNRIQTVTSVIRFIWSRWGKQITSLVSTAFVTVVKVIGGAMKIIGGIVKVITGIMTGDWKKAALGFKQIAQGTATVLRAIWNGIKTNLTTILTTLVAALRAKWNDFLTWTSTKLKAGLQKVKEFVLAPIRAARDGIKKLMDSIAAKFSAGVTAIGKAWDGLKKKASAPIKFVVNTVLNNGLVAAFNKIAGAVGIKTRLPSVHYATGGYTGPGAKYAPAGIVHADEFVVRKESRRRFEATHPGFLDHLNRTGTLPGYAGGGEVKTLQGVLGKLKGAGSGAFAQLASQGARTLGNAAIKKVKDALAALVVNIGKGVGGAVRAVIGRLGGGGGGIRKLARAMGASLSAHRDPQGGPAFDIFPRGSNGALGNAFRAAHGKLGLRYVISNMRIASARSNWNWRRYTPITGSGDFRHTHHTHVSYDSGGYLQPGLTLAYNGTGKPERIRTAEQEAALNRGGDTYHVQGYTAEEVARAIESERRQRAALVPAW